MAKTGKRTVPVPLNPFASLPMLDQNPTEDLLGGLVGFQFAYPPDFDLPGSEDPPTPGGDELLGIADKEYINQFFADLSTSDRVTSQSNGFPDLGSLGLLQPGSEPLPKDSIGPLGTSDHRQGLHLVRAPTTQAVSHTAAYDSQQLNHTTPHQFHGVQDAADDRVAARTFSGAGGVQDDMLRHRIPAASAPPSTWALHGGAQPVHSMFGLPQAPPARVRRPLPPHNEVQFGSDPNFGHVNYVPRSKRETTEALAAQQLATLRCLRWNPSAAPTPAASPGPPTPASLPGTAHNPPISDEPPDGAPRPSSNKRKRDDAFKPEPDGGQFLAKQPPRASRKRSNAHQTDGATPALPALRTARRRRSSPGTAATSSSSSSSSSSLAAAAAAIATTGAPPAAQPSSASAPPLPPPPPPRASSSSTSARRTKRPRRPLTEEEKRENHKRSERRRREEIERGYRNLKKVVPALRGGGSHSKAQALAAVIDWLGQIRAENARLGAACAELGGWGQMSGGWT